MYNGPNETPGKGLNKVYCKGISVVLGLMLYWPAQNLPAQSDPQLQQFKQAWQAANRGDRKTFDQIKSNLTGYILYPYLEYEDYRSRRAQVLPDQMAAFLDAHEDWAFTAGLRKSWLHSLGESRQWNALVRYAPGSSDVEVQCYLAQAHAEMGQAAEALPMAQELWAVGVSQPDVCDPLFDWLRKSGGITPQLAWTRVSRAMEARNPRLTLYLARFVPAHERVWVERWQQQDREGYTRLDRAAHWPDTFQRRDITAFGLKWLSRKNTDLAWKQFEQLDGVIDWSEAQRASIIREIALWSAVEQSGETVTRMHTVPASARDDALIEWWARSGLATQNWAEVVLAVAVMSEELRDSDRWRYWDARARMELGDPDYAQILLNELAQDADYYGFLAADYLGRPYAICALDPQVSAQAVGEFAGRTEIKRVEALDEAGLKNWSRSEWNLAVQRLPAQERRLAAAFATEQGWPYRAIMALTGGENQRYYEWRFPVDYAPQASKHAASQNIDVAWVLGLMRAESAMAEDAVSSANARGLMQVLPGTAAELARRHSYSYSGSAQLMQAEDNIRFGTTFLRELMNRFNNNPVLVSGAYNAGPGAVKRWLATLPGQDAAIWVEILPFYETRDYIPRVLAFATLYDWRLGQPVQRISSRMPPPDSGTMSPGNVPGVVAEVACAEPPQVALPGS